MTGTEGTVGSSLLKFMREKNYEIVEFQGDIRDKAAWNVYDYGGGYWDGVIHLAAIPGVRRSFKEPEYYFDVNVNGTQNALDFARRCNAKILYASSSNAYEWWGNPYAATKKMNEIQAQHYNAIGMRFHTVWPGRPDMLFMKLLNKEVTYVNENHYRDWIHIDDLCEAILIIFEKFYILKKDYSVLDIGTGHATPVSEVARVMGFDGEYRLENPTGERVITKANIEPLLSVGWTPKRNILNEASNFK